MGGGTWVEWGYVSFTGAKGIAQLHPRLHPHVPFKRHDFRSNNGGTRFEGHDVADGGQVPTLEKVWKVWKVS